MFQRALTVRMTCALMGLGVVTNCFGADDPQAATITVTGIVKPAASTAEESATVQVEGVLYRIVRDTKGTIVARDAAGKKAEIRGTLAERAVPSGSRCHGVPWWSSACRIAFGNCD